MREKSSPLKRMKAVCVKEFIHIKRDPRSLAIAVFAPVILLVIYAYGVTFDIKNINMGVVDYDMTRHSRKLAEKFTASGYFTENARTKNDMKKAVDALRTNEIRMILTIPAGFSGDLKKNKNTGVQVILDGSDSNTAGVAAGYAKRIILSFSKDITLNAVKKRGFTTDRVPAVVPEPRVWYNAEMDSQDFIVPGLIAIIMMLIAATLTSLTVVREKERGSFEQVVSTPIKPPELMAGKLAPYIAIGIIDVFLIVLVGVFWFKVPFRGGFSAFLIFTFLFIFCSMGLGLFMSSVAKSQTIAVIGTFFVTVLPSFLLSGFIFPVESMPWAIRIFTYLVPAKYFLTALRTLFLKGGAGMAVLYPQALFLLGFSALFLFLSAKNFKKKI